MKKNVLRWMFRIVFGLLTIIFIYGTIKQATYDSSVAKEFPPTGIFSDIGYNNIHFKTSGNGDLTFVLISGLGETMNTWDRIEKELQSRGKVFMYDRSGLGNSETGVLPRSVDICAKELHLVLKNENIKGPYVLIGHSVGGFMARYFAKKYPEDVLGIFLIDPYQEMSKEVFGEWPTSYKMMNWSFRNLSWSGIPYFLLPKPPHPTYKTSKAIRTFGEEAFAENISLQEFAKLDKEVSNLPIYLMTANKIGTKYNDIQKKWHKEILAKYSNKINEHIIIESGHHIHIDNPKIVIETVDEFLLKLKTKD